MSGTCWAFCVHGAQCILPIGHEQNTHSSGFCTFSDDQAVSEAEADMIIARMPGGEQILNQLMEIRELSEPETDEPDDPFEWSA